MGSELSKLALLNIISRIEVARETQGEIDSIYDNLCQAITDERFLTIPKIDSTKKTNKRFRHNKPYWNDDLYALWNIMRTKENDYLKYKGTNRIRLQLRADYVRSRVI